LTLRDACLNGWRVTRRHGWGAGLALLRSRLPPRSESLILFGIDCARADDPEPLPTGERMVLADGDEVRRFCEAGVWRPDRLEAYASGDRCLLHFEGDRLVGYTWASVSEVVVLQPGSRLRLPGDVAYVYKSFTAPGHRGRGAQARRTLHLRALLRSDGRTRVLCYVERTNFDSLRGVRKAGYREVGVVKRRTGPGHRWTLTIRDESWGDLRIAAD